MHLSNASQACCTVRNVLRFAVVIVMTIPAACDRPVAPPTSTDRLAWYVPGHHGAGIPTSDDANAYFSTREHFIVAVDKASGKVQWTARPNAVVDDVPPRTLVRAGDCLVVNDRDVWCLDPATGSVKWRFPSPPGFRAGFVTPAVAHGVVFTGSAGGDVFAIDLATGELRWQTQIATETNVYSPVVRDGAVYVAFNHFPLPPARVKGGVAVLDAATGSIRWQRDLPMTHPTAGSLTFEAVVAGGVMAATAADGYVYAHNIADGSVAWRGDRALPPPGGTVAELDFRVLGSDGAHVFVGSPVQGSVTKLDARDGAVVWIGRVDGDSPFSIQAYDTNVWVTTISGRVLAFDIATGTRTDAFDFPRLPTGTERLEERFSGVAVDDDLIYLPGTGGLFAFRR